MNVEIIEADYFDEKHASDVLYLTNAYAEDEMGMEQPLSEEVAGRLIRELQKMPTALSFIAYADGRPAGIANCFIGFATFEARKLINIHDLAVLPEFQGQGVGEALLGAVQKKARQLGCCRLTLEVRDDNHKARKLYERFGFENDDPSVWFLTKELY
jgi:ribosomal protein S18 acetylase RimI-like enzyme